MSDTRGFREAVVAGLRELLDDHGTNVSQVEKGMGRNRGYVGDALRGTKRLTFELLQEILDHVKVDPAEFLQVCAGRDARWDLGKAGRETSEIAEKSPSSELLRHLQERAAESGDPLLRDVSALLELLTRALEGKGIVSPTDVESALDPEASESGDD